MFKTAMIFLPPVDTFNQNKMKYNYLILTIGVLVFLNAQSQSDSSKITLDEFEVTTNRVGEQVCCS